MSDNAEAAAAASKPSLTCPSTMENIENLLAEMGPHRYQDEAAELKTSVGTQVDIRSWVLPSDINKEPSAEIYWRKMAEQSKAALEEARDENKKLHITIDFIARENIRYQEIIDTKTQEEKEKEEANDVLGYPLMPNNAGGAEAASALYFAQRDSDTSCSL